MQLTAEFGTAQDLSHAPQFSGSDAVSTQVPPQLVGLAAPHALAHLPSVHSGFELGQALSHEPQRVGVRRSVSQNSSSEAEQ